MRHGTFAPLIPCTSGLVRPGQRCYLRGGALSFLDSANGSNISLLSGFGSVLPSFFLPRISSLRPRLPVLNPKLWPAALGQCVRKSEQNDEQENQGGLGWCEVRSSETQLLVCRCKD